MLVAPHRRRFFNAAAASSIPSPDHYYRMVASSGTESDTGTGTTLDLTETGSMTANAFVNSAGRNCDDATTEYLSNTTLGSTYTGTKVFSAAGWVRFESITTSRTSFCGEGSVRYFNISTGAPDTLNWVDGSTLNFVKGTNFVTATAYHIAFGWASGGTTWLTVNNATPVSQADASLAGQVLLRFGSGSYSFAGDVAEWAVFDEDIRGAVLTELYNAGTGKFWNGSAWV